MRIPPHYTGTWRITEMSMWDQDYIDMVSPGHLTVRHNGRGELAFGAMEAQPDCMVGRAAASGLQSPS